MENLQQKLEIQRLSSKSDSIRLHKLRSKVDAILVGKNTVTQDDPLLTVRHTLEEKIQLG